MHISTYFGYMSCRGMIDYTSMSAIPAIFNSFYLTVSADPLSPATVENLTAIRVRLPFSWNTEALVNMEMSCVT